MLRRFSLLLAFLLLTACTGLFPNQSASTVRTATAPRTPQIGATITPGVGPATAPSGTELAATLAPATTAPAGSAPATPIPATAESTAAAAASATAAPAESPTPGAAANPANGVDDPARIAAATPAMRDQVALVEEFKHTGKLPRVARTRPLDVKVGDTETFWVADQVHDTNYTVTAKLRYAGPVVLMYVDTKVNANQSDVERSAKTFEEKIYPRDHALFGQEFSPGIDGDPRLTILNTNVRGAGGYFSSADTVVKAVNRFSNEREMFVIGINSYPLGSDGYASTLAHEFQHMIEWHRAPRSPSWFNEGMSMLAQDLNGDVEQGDVGLYLKRPDVQLTDWSSDAAQTHEHYGTSQLFLRYFYEQYAGDQGLAELIHEDAGNNLDMFARMAARKRPDIKSFADLYADWTVANVLDEPSVADGRYAYTLLPGPAAPTALHTGTGVTTVHQFGVDYLGPIRGPLKVSFKGAQTVGLAGARPAGGRAMWWSNRGDDSVQTLTRAFDLRILKQATLQFSTWYEIERNYDYAFVTVSTDGGTSWTPLKGKTTTTEDPQGQNLGNGLTGVSGSPGVEPDKGKRAQWIEEQMDLTPFAGKKILLRFWLVEDAGYNAEGMLIDNIHIPELGYRDDAEAGDGGWQAQGFVRTTGILPQSWKLRLIRVGPGKLTVEQVPVDGEGHGMVQLHAGERGLLAVMGTTPMTTEPATYTYTTTTGDEPVAAGAERLLGAGGEQP